MADSWGSGGDAFGSKMSLSELVDGLSAKKEVVETPSFPLAPSQADNIGVQVVPCVLSPRSSAPKILKKKSTLNKLNKEPNLKKVTFEVEQLLARESAGADKEELRNRLVVSLGGAPAKGKSINYKVLKEELQAKKLAAKQDVLTNLPNRVIKKKKK